MEADAPAADVVYASINDGGTVGDDRTGSVNNATGVTDEDLFKQPPPNGDCPICFLPQPLSETGRVYYPCCGKTVCIGCIRTDNKSDGRRICAFCRTPNA